MVEVALRLIEKEEHPRWTKPCYHCGCSMEVSKLIRRTERIDAQWCCPNCGVKEVSRI